MDSQAIDNPFRPAPGSEPPALVGRDEEIGAARYALAMTASGAPIQPIVFTGLHGMGKTALLRMCLADATLANAIVLSAEASRNEPLNLTLARSLERARRENASLPEKLKSGMGKVLQALPRATFELPNDLGAVSIAAGGEQKTVSLADALDELNTTVRDHKRTLVIAIDEIQDAPIEGLRDIFRFIHATAGTSRPAFFLAAGLPNSREHLHDVRTYTERWRYFRLELLSRAETKEAIFLPTRERGVSIEDSALERLADESAGYPFFVQEYASAAWLNHRGSTIDLADVERAIPGVRRILEDDFYDARFRLLTPRECVYVLAMAQLGAGPHTSGEIASILETTSDVVSSIRNQLIKKDIIFSPITGMAEFRIPLTERYVRDHRDELERRAKNVTVRKKSP